MKAILRELRVLELEDHLEKYWPTDILNFGIWVRLIIGPDIEPGAEFFDLFVCTPIWLNAECAKQKVVWGRHMLIVNEYDLEEIKTHIYRFVDNCTGENWSEIALQIAGSTAWEYENYQPWNQK